MVQLFWSFYFTTFPDILPNSALKQMNVSRPKTDLSESVKFSLSKPDSVENVRFSKNNITADEIKKVQSIGRKSVNDFTSDDIKKTEAFAKRYYEEMGVKSPFFPRVVRRLESK